MTRAPRVKAVCTHDLLRPIRIGRATWNCHKCGKDISLMVVMLAEAMADTPVRKRRKP